MSTTTTARKPLIDNTIANTDTQDLSISGHTISLTNGGSVTVPDNYRSISDSTSSASTTVSASSKAVKTAYDKGNHSHPYLQLTGGTLTEDVRFNKKIFVGHSDNDGSLQMVQNAVFGPDSQHTWDVALVNEQGSTNQSLKLHDVDFNNASPLFSLNVKGGDTNPASGGAYDNVFIVNADGSVDIKGTEVIGSDAKIDASKIKNVPASWLVGDTDTWRGISDSVTSTITTISASSKAVKTAYDKGNHSHPYAPTSHTHPYLPLSGGTVTDELAIKGSAPQIKLLDSDAGADDFWLHANSNNFYILTDRNDDGDFVDSNEWAPPLILQNASQDALLYGNKIATETYVNANAGGITQAQLDEVELFALVGL